MLRAADEADALVSQRDQMTHGIAHPFPVRNRHVIHAEAVHAPVQCDQGNPRRLKITVFVGLALRRDDDQARHAFLAQCLDVQAFAIGAPVRVAEEERIAACLQDVFEPAQDSGEEEILNVRDEDADGQASSRAQAARRAIRPVIQRGGSVEDTAAEAFANAGAPCEGARNRGRGDAGVGGDLPDGHANAVRRRGSAEASRHAANSKRLQPQPSKPVSTPIQLVHSKC